MSWLRFGRWSTRTMRRTWRPFTLSKTRSKSISRAGPGKFVTPQWDQASQKTVRDGLLTLATTLPDTKGMFGPRGAVDSVGHLIGAASAWGGNPEKDALYLNVVPAKNDGNTVYRLNVKDVPVDGFWSISVYNAKGYFEPNPQNAYTLNNIAAKANADGSVPVQFGGCDGNVSNCLPIIAGLELPGAALSAARRGSGWTLDLPGSETGRLIGRLGVDALHVRLDDQNLSPHAGPIAVSIRRP